MGYGFDWALSGLGLVFMGLGWAGLRILEPILNTGLSQPVALSQAVGPPATTAPRRTRITYRCLWSQMSNMTSA